MFLLILIKYLGLYSSMVNIRSVKPKPKYFCSPEEKKRFVDDYTRKLKTEMCKNWTTTGQCKFGDKVSKHF